MTTPETNPLVAALNPYVPQMLKLNQRYFKLAHKEHSGFIKDNYGFLVDALFGLAVQYLEPANIVRVFPWIVEITAFGVNEQMDINMKIYASYLRKSVVKIASSYCASHGLEGSHWAGLPRYYFETSEFPADVFADQAGITVFNRNREDYRAKAEIECQKARGSLSFWDVNVIADVFGNGCIRSI